MKFSIGGIEHNEYYSSRLADLIYEKARTTLTTASELARAFLNYQIDAVTIRGVEIKRLEEK